MGISSAVYTNYVKAYLFGITNKKNLDFIFGGVHCSLSQGSLTSKNLLKIKLHGEVVVQ